MSKIIETLRASAREATRKKSAPATPQKGSYELTQEQLADIYFSSSQKEKKSDLPLVIRVVEKPSPRSWAPWVLASAAILMAAFSLFSTKRIFVDIKIVDDKTPYSAYAKPEGEAVSRVSGAALSNPIPAQNVVFEGAAKLKSLKTGSEFTLVNSSIAAFARANLYFVNPLNLEGSKIVFYAKGQKGGENLAVALRDKENILAFQKGDFRPFPMGLTAEWQRGEIPLSGTVQEFDLRKITNLRFEFGSKDTQNKPGDTIFVKDIQVVPL